MSTRRRELNKSLHCLLHDKHPRNLRQLSFYGAVSTFNLGLTFCALALMREAQLTNQIGKDYIFEREHLIEKPSMIKAKLSVAETMVPTSCILVTQMSLSMLSNCSMYLGFEPLMLIAKV